MGSCRRVLWFALAVGCGGAGDERGSSATFASGASAGSDDGATDDGGEVGSGDNGVLDSTGGGSGGDGAGCPGACEPAAAEMQPCPGGTADQVRVCNDDCTWSPWSACPPPMGECAPGQTQSCGECMEQTCDAAGTWGPCVMACSFTCLDSARNGSEICDDQAFDVPNEPLYLVCVTDEGGVGYVAHNTGPQQADGVPRCQGWEDMGLNAWDFLDYEQTMDCDMVDKSMLIALPAGSAKWYGVHDQPDGSGHFTEVCIATLQ